MNKCLIPNCTRPAAPALKRELCMLCYSKAKHMVEAGTTTWGEIAELGLALPSDGEGADPFTKAFKQAKEAKHAGNE